MGKKIEDEMESGHLARLSQIASCSGCRAEVFGFKVQDYPQPYTLNLRVPKTFWGSGLRLLNPKP